jgi:hypothetical protein
MNAFILNLIHLSCFTHNTIYKTYFRRASLGIILSRMSWVSLVLIRDSFLLAMIN